MLKGDEYARQIEEMTKGAGAERGVMADAIQPIERVIRDRQPDYHESESAQRQHWGIFIYFDALTNNDYSTGLAVDPEPHRVQN